MDCVGISSSQSSESSLVVELDSSLQMGSPMFADFFLKNKFFGKFAKPLNYWIYWNWIVIPGKTPPIRGALLISITQSHRSIGSIGGLRGGAERPGFF